MKKNCAVLLGLLAIQLIFLFNLRFTAWPEMLSYPYLLNNGFTLYKDFVYPYPPLLTLLLAGLYRIFGYNLLALKVFTWLLILVNDVFIFKIVKKLAAKEVFAMYALAFYVFTQPFLEGNQLWFDLAIVTPILIATYFLLSKKYFVSGILFGIAALTKQTAGIFLVIGGLLTFGNEKNVKKVLEFLAGPVILGLSFVVFLISQKALTDFVNWNLVYPFIFWSKFPGYVQMNLTNGQIVIIAVLLFPLLVLISKNYRTLINYRLLVKDKYFLAIGLFLIASFVLVYPRFSFFHFQLALAFIAIFFGYLMGKFKFSSVLLAAFCMLVLFAVILPSAERDWGIEARFWSGDDLKFAQKVAKETGGQNTYLLGQPSSMYVFASILPPKPWLDNYGWYFEIGNREENTLNRWELNQPKYIIWQEPEAGNWYDLGVYQPKKITNWILENYIKKEKLEKGVWLWQKRG